MKATEICLGPLYLVGLEMGRNTFLEPRAGRKVHQISIFRNYLTPKNVKIQQVKVQTKSICLKQKNFPHI